MIESQEKIDEANETLAAREKYAKSIEVQLDRAEKARIENRVMITERDAELTEVKEKMRKLNMQYNDAK